MGLIDDLSKALTPHSQKLNDTLNLQGAVLHQRLGNIESHLSDLNRPDVGDLWRDIEFNAALTTLTPAEIENVALNEVWSVQSMSVVAAVAVTRIIVRANGKLRIVLPSSASLPATFSCGGNVVFLPGEKITIESEGTGQVEASLQVTRNQIPGPKTPVHMGREQGEQAAPTNTHDPARDIVRAGPGYTETRPEVRPSVGSPPAIDPTSV